MMIALLGWIGSGKDTVAAHLSVSHNFIKDSFASSLKDSCAALFEWPRHLLEGNTVESRIWREEVDQWWATKLGDPTFTPRKALQLIGTEVFRENFHKNIWLLTFQRRLETKNVGKNVLVSDCRFKNEIEFFKSCGGKIVFVDAGDRPVWYNVALRANTSADSEIVKFSQNEMKTKYAHVHLSEWDWIGTEYDFVIKNDFVERNTETYEALKHRVDESVQFLKNL